MHGEPLWATHGRQLPIPAWLPSGALRLFSAQSLPTPEKEGATQPTQGPPTSPKGPESQAFSTIWMKGTKHFWWRDSMDVCVHVCVHVCAHACT